MPFFLFFRGHALLSLFFSALLVNFSSSSSEMISPPRRDLHHGGHGARKRHLLHLAQRIRGRCAPGAAPPAGRRRARRGRAAEPCLDLRGPLPLLGEETFQGSRDGDDEGGHGWFFMFSSGCFLWGESERESEGFLLGGGGGFLETREREKKDNERNLSRAVPSSRSPPLPPPTPPMSSFSGRR